MKRVLLTGMSGKPLPDGRQQWREDAIRRLLDNDDADVLFVAGCEENQEVRTTAPLDDVVERVLRLVGA